MFANDAISPCRSLIFCPGNKPEMYPKALQSGSDMVCVELEDGVAPADKEQARLKGLALFDSSTAASDDRIERVVRINSLRSAFGLADIQAILAMPHPPPTLMLPKVSSADEVLLLDALLTEHGHPTRLYIIIETNPGLEAAYAIAGCCERIVGLLFGGMDMSAELRCRAAWEPLLYARSRVVHAAAGAGVNAIDVPFLDLNDSEGLRVEARRAAALGFTGKAAIHPQQIETVNRVFSPDAATVAYARKVVDGFTEGNSGLVVIDGKLIEKPVLRSMRRILAIAERLPKPA